MALKVNAAAGFPQNMPVVLLQMMTAFLSGSSFCYVVLFYDTFVLYVMEE